MTKIVALTQAERTNILNQLSPMQVEALNEFTRYAMLSRFHTRHYLRQTDWEFQGMVIDPWYDRRHEHRGDNLYCDCGRRLKNQFILRSKTTGHHLFLGISHFQQHASIPAKVEREIRAGINEINLYMDGILVLYQAKREFPTAMFQYVVTHHGFKNQEGTILYQRCNLFRHVNLPLHPRDYEELKKRYLQLKAGKIHRLTKKEITNLLQAIADDWRQVDQQIILFNYQLRQESIPPQSIQRIKSNSINYALQRRHTRFFVTNYKHIKDLTLTKARAQLAIKLRQLSFYIQIMDDRPRAKYLCDQARQIMIAHETSVSNSHFFGIKEAKSLINGMNVC
ncbi:hypothetical protein H5S09_09275 [Limosilactobacillus sp. STM2_1]|uniref:Uncharacterized protein n=1 Tax=Limosilactobacillus rudii TaxID=2759755 RepID=A0A7W3UM63_9LACO|nr:hypothetical protein [Limosilactobacillus rudii]MBB1079994.1 hypothetical protein [Limosilactobacillus rudii]MBB1098127.1 hypothetical protein [Limosilactobacillus rudii]MCD7135197.1 hypothetical protein [Limosilactobacillus rudii]